MVYSPGAHTIDVGGYPAQLEWVGDDLPTVLVLAERWIYARPDHGDSWWINMLTPSGTKTTVVNTLSVYYDECYTSYGIPADNTLRRAARDMGVAVDYCLLTVPMNADDNLKAGPVALYHMNKVQKVPIAVVHCDTYSYDIHRSTMDIYSPFATLHVSLDCASVVDGSRPMPFDLSNWVCGTQPKDDAHYYDNAGDRPVDILTNAWQSPPLNGYAQALRNAGHTITDGGAYGIPLSDEIKRTDAQYGDLLRTAKVVLVASKISEMDVAVRKGRVFDAMHCGAVVVTEDSDELRKTWTPGTHLMAFKSDAELVRLVEYLLSHPEERRTMALNGIAELKANHTLDVFWETILEGLDASTSQTFAVGDGEMSYL